MEKLERYDSYKESGIEWLGEIPSHWSRTKLKSLLDIKTGKKDVNASDENGKYPFFTCASEPHKINTYTYDCEALLVAGNGIVGNTQYYNGKFDAYQRTYILYQFRNVLSVSFIKHYIQGLLKTHLADKSNGSVIDFIKVGDLRDFIVSLPPLEEQQKIAQYLDTKTQAMDSVISKKQQLVEKLKLAKQALITETVTKGLDPTVPMKDSGVEWIGEIPEHWEISKFKYEVKIDPSKSDVAKLPKDTEVSFTPMEKLRHGKLDGSVTKLLGDVYNGYTYIRDGDIAMAKVTPCYENYNIAIANDLKNGIAFGSSEILVLRSIGNIDTRMVYYYMQHFNVRGLMISTMTGAAGLKRISNKVLMDIPILIQDKKEQTKIVDYLDKKVSEFDQLIKLEEQSIEKLKLTKQKLITEVVTGKINVQNL